MQIKKYVLADEGEVLKVLQPCLRQKLQERRMPEWSTGRIISADQPVPVITRESGGVYRRFLQVRGLPGADEMPRFDESIDYFNQKRGILPLAGFQIDYLSRNSADPFRSVWPAQRDQMFFIAGTYDWKPQSLQPDCFYPFVVRSGGGLHHTSYWEPLFIDPGEAQFWLEPLETRTSILRSRPFGYFAFGKRTEAA